MTNWEAPLAHPIIPKSGPLRSMTTLLDANRALMLDLPKTHRDGLWMAAGKLLVVAGERGQPGDVEAATEALVVAIEREGWMDRTPTSFIIETSATARPDGSDECPAPREGMRPPTEATTTAALHAFLDKWT